MRDHLKKSARWLDLGSLLAVVFLLLPVCGLNTTGIGQKPTQNLDQGDQPWSSMIMCHIEKIGGRHCPDSWEEIEGGIRFFDAAIALVEDRVALYGVDDTAVGKSHCDGEPEIVELEGGAGFPDGIAVCLNCSQNGSFTDAVTACRQRCYDFHGTTRNRDDFTPTIPPEPNVKAHCDDTSRVATNGLLLVNGTDKTCYPNLCSDTGGFSVAVDNDTGIETVFSDPREVPEPVIWTDLHNTEAAGAAANDLTRSPQTTGDAGAVSKQWITHGDAYVEFAVSSADHTHIIGLSSVPAGCTEPQDCPDDDAGFANIGFAMKLDPMGTFILDNGEQVDQGEDDSFGQYVQPNIRLRITVRDNGDDQAIVSYSWLYCETSPCDEVVLHENDDTLPSYPFRVDAFLLETGATLTDVRLVRIQ